MLVDISEMTAYLVRDACQEESLGTFGRENTNVFAVKEVFRRSEAEDVLVRSRLRGVPFFPAYSMKRAKYKIGAARKLASKVVSQEKRIHG